MNDYIVALSIVRASCMFCVATFALFQLWVSYHELFPKDILILFGNLLTRVQDRSFALNKLEKVFAQNDFGHMTLHFSFIFATHEGQVLDEGCSSTKKKKK